MMNRLFLAAIVAATASACAPMMVQSPGHGLSPVNAVAEGEDHHLMLFGADVVSYFTDPSPAMGLPTIKSVYKHVTFRFATAEHKAMFDAAPGKYVPQFGGYCTNGIVYAVPWGGSVDSWEMIDGKLYMFGGRGARDAFMLHPKENMALAEKYWREEVDGSNAFFQRTRRVIFKVPHWKTSEELAAEVAAAKKKG
jgi:hypothetical protein